MRKKTSSLEKEVRELRENLSKTVFEYNLVMNEIQIAIGIYRVVFDEENNPVDYIVVNVNKKFVEYMGFIREEVMNKSVNDLFSGSKHLWGVYFKDAVTTGQPQRFDRYSPRSKMWLDISIKSLDREYLFVTFHDISKRKNAEIALEESRNMLNEMGKMARVGGWEHDLKTGKAKWTDCLYDLTGYDPQKEPPGVESHLRYYPEEWRIKVRDVYKKIISEKKPSGLEAKYMTSRGLRWANIYAEPVIADEQVVKLKGFFQDITDAKEAELGLIAIQKDLKEKNEEYLAINEEYLALNEELTESNAKIQRLNESLIIQKEKAERSQALYHTIFKTIKEGIFIFQSKNELEYINPAACELYKMDQNELLRKRPSELFSVDSYNVFEGFINAVDKNEDFHAQARGINKRNEPFEIILYGCAIHIDHKKKYYCTIRDITRQKQYEAEIEEKNEFIQKILDLNPNHIYIYDIIKYKNLYFNRAARDFYGLTPDEMNTLEGGSLKSFVHPDDLQDLYDHFHKLEKAEDNEIFETVYRVKDQKGEYKWFYNKDSVFKRASDGRVEQVIASSTDVTRRKIIEQKLEEQNKEITAQNEEYLALNEELEESNNKLIKANEELDSFVYRVSHDLRAPIASSLGLANLTLKEPSMDYIREYSRLQIESLKRLDEFIKDILNYSRNSRLNLNIEQIDLNVLVSEVVQLQQNYDGTKKEIQFTTDIQEGVSLRSDRLRLKIILNNLLSNAFKYYDEEKEESFVKLTITSLNKGFVEISILDNGIGINEEHIESVYDMFYRATVKGTGSGLGLYIVRDCLSKIHGSIELTSVEGKGTEFTIVLPHLSLS